MLIRPFVIGMFAVALILLATGEVLAQNYPNKPIRIITGAAAGGGDLPARLIAQGISGPLGQPVIVDNRGGINLGEIAAKAPPDGYTLLGYGTQLWIGPFLQKLSYDAEKDFAPITSATRSPLVVVVHPSLPVKTVKDLVALGKVRPGELNYGSNQNGSSTHLAAELFKSMASVNIVGIPYKGTAQAVTDLVGGRVQLMISTGPAVAPHIKSGRLRALAVTSAEPSALYPGLPTVAASGVPAYEAVSLQGVFAPAKTPEAIIKRLNQEIVRVLNQTDVKQKFFDTGVEAVSSSPEQFAATIKSEMARMGKVIKDAGIRAEQ